MIAGWTKDRSPVALVTGASRGIGACVARYLVDSGFDLIVIGRDIGALDALHAGLGDNAHEFQPLVADLGKAGSFDALATSLPHVDVLINSAGAIHGTDGWKDETRDDVERSFDLNYTACLRLAQLVAPGMVAQGWGRIINLTSIYGFLGSPYVATYSATKAALHSLTRSLAVDLAAHGVTVNSISPGNIETEMTLSAGADYIAQVTARTPVGRLGQPDEVARVVAFLLESPFVTGADIVVDGGLSLVGG